MGRWSGVVALALAVGGILLAAMAFHRWLVVLTPRWAVRGASIGVLWALFAIYVIAIPSVLIGVAGSALALARARRRQDSVLLRKSLRLLLFSSSCLVGMIATELGSATKLRWLHRLPVLPTQFAARASTPAIRSEAADAVAEAADALYLVVVGESSARGEPYHPWLSVGQIVGWQIERIFPGRKVRVDVRAGGGLCLEQAVLLLKSLERRPDAIIVFSGHNEFVTRLGPSRNVRHYVEEGPLSQLALLDLARSRSSTARLILATLDSFYGERPPPPDLHRQMIDHPVQTPKEYRFLCEDFSIRLDALTEYCTSIGSLPILIVPGSNDGSFEPSRSVLDGSTREELRSAFGREFQVVRAAETVDPAASIAAYRRLAKQHPEFAETHYRLGRLLAAAGEWDDARAHFTLARDLDGLMIRCPSDLHQACRSVARRHGAMLVDGPRVLARAALHGVLDDYLFHDAQHVNLRGIVALANDTLEQLKERGAFGWPLSTPAPRVDVDECARHFELDAKKWSEICGRSASFYFRTSAVRFDPSDRFRVGKEYEQAAIDLEAGRPVKESKIASIALAAALVESGRSDRAGGSRGTAPTGSPSGK